MDLPIFRKRFAKDEDGLTSLSIVQWQFSGKDLLLNQQLAIGVTANIFGLGGKIYFQISFSEIYYLLILCSSINFCISPFSQYSIIINILYYFLSKNLYKN